MNNHDAEKYLEKLVMDIDCLNELNPWVSRFNIFDILKSSKSELKHSNVLAWLLTPNENHGVGDLFLRLFIQKYIQKNALKFDVFDILLLDFYSFRVYREYKNIDIMIVSDSQKVAIVIENKVESHEHSRQLERYYNILKNDYCDYKKLCVFLTPKGEKPENLSDRNNWGIFTYGEIADILDYILDSVDIKDEVGFMLRNYLEIIRRDIVEDQKLKEICEKIYNNHKIALELIFKYKRDNKNKVIDIVHSTLQELSDDGVIIFDEERSKGVYQIFYTDGMDELMPELTTPISSWTTTHVYEYWFKIDESQITGYFELGGWNLSETQATAQKNIIQLEKPRIKAEEYRYKRIYNTKRMALNDTEEIEDEIRKYIRQSVNDFLVYEKNLIKKIRQLSV